jgi:predicted PurR-regulated permease PerM
MVHRIKDRASGFSYKVIRGVLDVIINKRHIRIAFVLIFISSSVLFLWFVRHGLYPFIIAFFLAYLLNPAVCYLEYKGLKRVTAILIIYILVFGLLIIGGSRLFPLVIRELENFSKDLPAMINAIEDQIQIFQWKYQNSALPYSLRLALDDRLMFLEREGQIYVSSLVDSLMGLITYLVGLAITPVLAFYLLADWYVIKDELLLLIPGRWRHEFLMVCKDLDKVLSGVIRGQVTIAMIVGMLVSLGLYLLNVKYALIIGIFAGMLDLIPYFGAVIGATPAVTIALLDSPYLALKVIILFFLIHQLEGTVIGPKILGESVGLHPLSVIFFVFVGSEIGGLAGMLLGVPAAAISKVLLRHIVKALV